MTTTNSGLDLEAIMASKVTSHWLKNTLASAMERDPVDALDDAETLVSILEQRLTAIQGQ